jgi:ribosomal protein S18 acetylase RimI-like enzyme
LLVVAPNQHPQDAGGSKPRLCFSAAFAKRYAGAPAQGFQAGMGRGGEAITLIPGEASVTPEEPIIIEHLQISRVDEAVAVLCDAFRDDPVFRFYFPDPIMRAKVLRLFFNNVIRAHMRFSHVYAAVQEDRIVGAAVWRTPDAAANTLRDRLREFVTQCRLIALSRGAASGLSRGFASLEATHPNVPHWYLFFIGVSSKLRGSGLGARLMAPVLAAADAANSICYLETPFSQTLPFYRGLGYEVSSEPRPFAGAPQLWAMTRRPKPKG